MATGAVFPQTALHWWNSWTAMGDADRKALNSGTDLVVEVGRVLHLMKGETAEPSLGDHGLQS